MIWLAVTLLSLIVLLVIVLPLWRARPATGSDATDANVAIYRDRLAELQADRQAGRLSEAELEAQRLDLARTLLGDSDQQRRQDARGHKTARALALLISLAVIGTAAGYYRLHGYAGPVADWEATKEQLAPAVVRWLASPQDAPTPEAIDRNLEPSVRVALATLQRGGYSDVKGMLKLTATLLQVGVAEPARKLAERAYELAPERIDSRMALAQALVMGNEGRLEPRGARLIESILSDQPTHPGARMLLGFAAYNAGDYQIALTAWQSLRRDLPDDAELAGVLDEVIAEAHNALIAGTPAATGEAAVQVTVGLDPALAARVPADAVLFVFARAVDGPPMPLAVVRQPVGDWPVTVVLDETRAMQAARPLQAGQAVQVQARISLGGTATASSGDLESDPVRLTVGERGAVELTINRQRQ